MTRPLSLLSLLLTGLLIAGCTGPIPARPIQTAVTARKAGDRALRVGITPNYPPLIYREQGKVVGLEAEFASRLAKRLGREVLFYELAWEALIPALEQGEMDIIMSGMSITEMRSQRVAFSSPYLKIGQMVLLRAESRRDYPDPRLIAVGTTKIGVEKGTTGDLFVLHHCSRSSRKAYRDMDRAVKALLKGDVEVVVHDAPLIWQAAAKHEADGLVPLPGYLTEEYLAWATARSNTALMDAANAMLKDMTESGEYAELIQRWVPAVALRQ